jgi:hypothetical protein
MAKNFLVKKRLGSVAVAIALSLPAVLWQSSASMAQETESATFTLSNMTDRELLEFYASPPDEESWEEDILYEPLGPGESVEVTIDDGREDCYYDFMGVLGPAPDGSVGEGALIQSGVEVCDGGSYEYYSE